MKRTLFYIWILLLAVGAMGLPLLLPGADFGPYQGGSLTVNSNAVIKFPTSTGLTSDDFANANNLVLQSALDEVSDSVTGLGASKLDASGGTATNLNILGTSYSDSFGITNGAVFSACYFGYATANRVPIFNGTKYLTASSVTSTELGYLSGVSSGIQSQFTSQAALISANTASITANAGGATATDALLKEWTTATAFELTASTADSDGCISSATLKWPDGSGGTFTRTAKDSTWLVINAYTASHTASGKTVTQSAVTRDANGVVTTKPALTVN